MLSKFHFDTWLKVDALIDWPGQAVELFVNGERKGREPFFNRLLLSEGDSPVPNRINGLNSVHLYNLSPGATCFLKDVELCLDRCAGEGPRLELSSGARRLVGAGAALIMIAVM